MRRTTVAIDPPILEELREVADKKKIPLRKLINQFLAQGLRSRNEGKDVRHPRLKWKSQKMGSRIDYTDKDALYTAMDEGK